MSNISLRSTHVPDERISALGDFDYEPVQITIQEHLADRRGKHYDLRIVTPDRAISFVIPWGDLSKPSGERGTWIRMPDHVPEYANWEGQIPAGQYGAGKVRVVAKYNGILHSSGDHPGLVDLFFEDGDDYRKISFSSKDGQKYLAISRNLPDQRHWQERPIYKALTSDQDTSGLWASEKLDGALVYIKLGEKGITVTSRRKSTKTGKELVREHHVPWIRDTKIPKELQGMTFAGELVHPMGFSFTGPIMNSKPSKAVAAQKITGKMQLYLHNVLSDDKTPYAQKVELMRGVIQALGNPNIKLPRISVDPDKFFDQVRAEGGEGVILVDPRSPGNVMYKNKLWDHYTGEIVDVLEGKGKNKGSLGAMLVRDKDGRLVHLGGGVGLSDKMRREIFGNPKKFVGRKVRVVARGSTGASLRQPRFAGFAIEDDPLDSFASQEAIYRDYVDSLS